MGMDIAIGIITYNRPTMFNNVVESIKRYVIYPKENIHLVIHDDGSNSDYWKIDYKGYASITYLESNRGGMPIGWNKIIKECHTKSDYIMPLMDDWLFTSPLDLNLALAFLEENPNYGMIRYHKLTGHVGLDMRVKEWQAKTINVAKPPLEYNNFVPYLELLPPQNDIYSPFSGGVHFRHKRFTDFYGDYTEKIGFSNAEQDYFIRINEQLRSNESAPKVAMFPYYIHSRFRDLAIDASYRNTHVEKETIKK